MSTRSQHGIIGGDRCKDVGMGGYTCRTYQGSLVQTLVDRAKGEGGTVDRSRGYRWREGDQGNRVLRIMVVGAKVVARVAVVNRSQ